MIKFKQFIIEATPGVEIEFLDICKRISSECGDFLSEAGTAPLMRGLSRISGGVQDKPQEISQPVNRQPKDSDPGFNLLFNSGIEAVYKISNIRTKTLYTTGSGLQAKQYGKIAFVFPKDGFKFLYSPSIQDSYEESDEIDNLLLEHLHDAGATMNKYQLDGLFNYLADEEQMTPTDLLKLPSTLTKLNVYYDREVRGDYRSIAKLGDVFKKCLIKTFKELDYRNTDLKNAISRKTEISFYESNGFYLVPMSSVRSHFSKLPQTELDTPSQCYAKLLELL